MLTEDCALNILLYGKKVMIFRFDHLSYTKVSNFEQKNSSLTAKILYTAPLINVVKNKSNYTIIQALLRISKL